MIPFTCSQKLSKKTPLLLPLYYEDADIKKRRVLEGLTRAQKRAIRSYFKNDQIPKSGFFPIASGDAIVFLMLLGKKEESSRRDVREAAEGVFAQTKKFEIEELAILSGSLKKELFTAFQEGILLGSYEFLEYMGKKKDEKKKKDEEKKLKKVQFFIKSNKKDAERIAAIAEGVKWTKDTINTPPSDCRPSYLVNVAKTFAKELPKVTATILGKKELEKLGCGGILGVARGGKEDPQMIILEYKAGAAKEQPIIYVGKGVTYDTGGYNIKGRYMRWMKHDLGGAATALGGFYAIAKTGVKKNVTVVIPAVENMVSENAYFPDDVLTMYNGMTVEVHNTDAEGRLILADALAYADEQLNPKMMVDMATLTGACAYAVGDDFTALLGNKKIIKSLYKSAENTDELVWELPLHDRYAKKLKSSIADIVNCSDGLKPGTIEGGLFLKNFVKKETPWVHMDIASVAFDDTKGLATGKNIRLLLDFTERN